jgi:hypothetical protein
MVHPTCSIEIVDMTGSVTGLYCTYVYYTACGAGDAGHDRVGQGRQDDQD